MGATKEMFIAIQDELVNTLDKYDNGEQTALETLLYMRGFRTKAEEIIAVTKDFETQNIEAIETESQQHGGSFKGHEIKRVNGRKTYSFKHISEIQNLESKKKELEKQYQYAFDGVQKGIVQTTESDGKKYWIDENGEMKELPEINYGASYITVKKSK